MVFVVIRVDCVLVVIFDGVGVGMMVAVAIVEMGVGWCTGGDF